MAVGDNSECFMRRTTYNIIHYVNSVCVCCVLETHSVDGCCTKDICTV
jgi:hypothetical protein